MVELLSPAGDWPSLRAAIEAGADAVYFGIKELNMRMKTKNFTLSELNKITKLCHENKIKCYLTLNSIIYDDEVDKLRKIIIKAKQAKVDAIIAWDLAVLNLANKYSIPIHLSTQASVSNSESLKLYKKLGIKRVILARELNLKQIKSIDFPKEIFIHGALCYSISGRCFLSQDLYNFSANRGECLQVCRRTYKLTDLETNKEIKVNNQFLLSAKDLCTLPFLNRILKTNPVSIKIEGRNRSPEYVYTITNCYRKALNLIKTGKFNKENINKLMDKLKTVYNRKLSSGFYLGLPTADDITDIYGSAATKRKVAIGQVINYYSNKSVAVIELKHSLSLNDDILIIGNTTGVVKQKVTSMEILNKKVNYAEKGQAVAILTNNTIRKKDNVYLIRDSN